MTRLDVDQLVFLGCAFLLGVVVGMEAVGRDRPLDTNGGRASDGAARGEAPRGHVPAAPLSYIAPALGLQRYMDCQRQRGRAALRLQIAHKRDREGIQIHCYYDYGVYL